MRLTSKQYLQDCKRHLVQFNAKSISPDMLFSVYHYEWDLIIKHKSYFDKCRIEGLSTYKALLYFENYLNNL